MRHRHRRKPPGTATPSAYRHRASRRLYPPPANNPFYCADPARDHGVLEPVLQRDRRAVNFRLIAEQWDRIFNDVGVGSDTGGSCTNPLAAGRPAARHIGCGSVRFWFHERLIPKKGLDHPGGGDPLDEETSRATREASTSCRRAYGSRLHPVLTRAQLPASAGLGNTPSLGASASACSGERGRNDETHPARGGAGRGGRAGVRRDRHLDRRGPRQGVETMTADSRQLGADARIARELGCSKNTVRRYVAADGWMAYSRRSGGGKLEDQEAWLTERFFQHRGGNAEVVRQEPQVPHESSLSINIRRFFGLSFRCREGVSFECRLTRGFDRWSSVNGLLQRRRRRLEHNRPTAVHVRTRSPPANRRQSTAAPFVFGLTNV